MTTKRPKHLLEDLTGKTVQLYQRCLEPGLRAEDHLFRCQSGSGLEPGKIGSAIFGYFLSDQEDGRFRRGDIEFIVEG